MNSTSKLTIFILILVTISCRTPESKQNTTPVPNYGPTVSCFLSVSGTPRRCTEYGPNIENYIKHSAKSTCGVRENGLDGYTWHESPCPTQSIIGDCQAKDTSKMGYTHGFFYSPAYTKERAHSDCDSTDYLLKEYP